MTDSMYEAIKRVEGMQKLIEKLKANRPSGKPLQSRENPITSTSLSGISPTHTCWNLPEDRFDISCFGNYHTLNDNIIATYKRLMPIKTERFDPVPQMSNLGYRWIPRARETRRAMNLYFEEFYPEMIRQGFELERLDLTMLEARWKNES